MTDKAGQIRKGEELDWKSLEPYLKSRLPDTNGKMTVSQFHGGHANLSYLICFGEAEYVLRRPPFGKIAPGAHDMHREFRVLSVLNTHYSPAPRAYLYCKDEGIIGASFVVMERRKGVVIRYCVPEEFSSYDNIEQRLTRALIKAQSDLHLVNYQEAGLENLGKPEGFLLRQITAWKKRWQLLEKSENDTLSEILISLGECVPATSEVSIIHNDFKFDNCQFQSTSPDEVYSVFDWDMATLGDPLFDFASSLVYWPEAHLDDKKLPILLQGDFPDKSYLKEKYFQYTSFDSSKFKWYECLAFVKTAVIAKQLYTRYKAGDSSDKRMLKFETVSDVFVNKAEKLLEQV